MASQSHTDLIKSQSTTLSIDIPFIIRLFYDQQRSLEITHNPTNWRKYSYLFMNSVCSEGLVLLTHWCRVMHICVGTLTIIGWDNGLSPGRRQAIIWTNAEILLIRTLGTNFSDFLSEIGAFSFKKMHLKMSSGKWQPSCFGLNVLRPILLYPYGITKPCGWIKSQTPTVSIEILLVIWMFSDQQTSP